MARWAATEQPQSKLSCYRHVASECRSPMPLIGRAVARPHLGVRVTNRRLEARSTSAESAHGVGHTSKCWPTLIPTRWAGRGSRLHPNGTLEACTIRAPTAAAGV